jgi:hypothetical protein
MVVADPAPWVYQDGERWPAPSLTDDEFPEFDPRDEYGEWTDPEPYLQVYFSETYPPFSRRATSGGGAAYTPRTCEVYLREARAAWEDFDRSSQVASKDGDE